MDHFIIQSICDLPKVYLAKLAAYHILSVFKPPNSPGILYFETSEVTNVRLAINEVWTSPIRVHRITAVPLAEMPKVLSTRGRQRTLMSHSWVRLNRGGKYKGDLAFVDSLNTLEGYAHLLLIPRLPPVYQELPAQKRKRKMSISYPQALFDHVTITAAYQGQAARDITHISPPKAIDEDTWSYNSETLYKGLCRMRVAVLSINLSSTEPSETELFQWVRCTHEPIRREIEQLLSSFTSSSRSKPPLCVGDRVKSRSTQPEAEDLSGTIVSIEDIDRTEPTVLVRQDLTDAIQMYAITDLEKEVRVGDLMEVDGGSYSGALGTVVGIDDRMVSLLFGDSNGLDQVWY